MQSLSTALHIASLLFLVAGAFDPLREEGAWAWMMSTACRLAAWVVAAAKRMSSAMLWRARVIWRRLLRKPPPPTKVAVSIVLPGGPTIQARVDVAYPDAAAELRALWNSVRGVQRRLTTLEQDSPGALAQALEKERGETLRRGVRAFRYIMIGIALEVGAVVASHF
jgi:hypothetical protein